MIFSNPSQLDWLLIQILTKSPGSTANALHRMASRRRPCSLQGIYHELSKLQDRNVILKVGKAFFLNITWANELLSFADDVYENYFQSAESLSFLAIDKKRQSWQFTSCIRADDFYVHASLALCRATKCKEVFEWVPHPWFSLLKNDKESMYQRTLQTEKIHIYCIIGGDTPLDRAYTKSELSPLNTYSFAVSPFETLQREYFQVIEDYVVTLTISEDLARSFERTFQVGRKESMNSYLPLLRRSKVRVRIEHSPQKGLKLSRQFREFFGC